MLYTTKCVYECTQSTNERTLNQEELNKNTLNQNWLALFSNDSLTDWFVTFVSLQCIIAKENHRHNQAHKYLPPYIDGLKVTQMNGNSFESQPNDKHLQINENQKQNKNPTKRQM